MSPVIQLVDVLAGYSRQRPVLRAINLSVSQCELVAVLGSSGIGKSTLLRVVAGGLRPLRGSAQVLGREVGSLSPRERSIGLVFQHLALFPNLSVLENIAFGLRYSGIRVEEQAAQAQRLMEFLRIASLAKKMPHELSGGQAQRGALARALAPKPRILLLDEPFYSLDRPLADAAREMVTRVHREQGLTTLIVTHDWEQALTIADRIVILGCDGRIVQDSTPMQAYGSPCTAEAASLTGPVNLLHGRVSSVNGLRLSIETSSGTVEAKWGSDKPVPSVATGVQLVVRPEWMRIDRQVDSQSTMPIGEVTQVVQVGTRCYVHLQANGHNLVAECSDSAGLSIGSRVGVAVNPELALAYPLRKEDFR